MGTAFYLVELTVQLIKPICNGSAAMAVKFRWHENTPAVFLVKLKVRADLLGRLQFH